MPRLRVVHYLNQFFAGVGGEKQAHLPPQLRAGPVGPGAVLQNALGGEAEVVATVYCGDEYLSLAGDEGLGRIVDLISGQSPRILVAGPAFAAGRYGFACGAVAQAVEERLAIPSVIAMAEENPAVELYRQKVSIVPTGPSPTTMMDAIGRMARLALKRGRGERLGSPEEDGYLARGIRENLLAARPAGERVVDLLMAKLRGEQWRTEIPLPRIEPMSPAAPLRDVRHATIALLTTGGVVPRGNPERIEARRASRWSRLDITRRDDLSANDWENVHGGFDHDLVAADPDRLLPVDVMRDLEREGRIGRLHEVCYATVGAGAPIERTQRFGREIGAELVASGVQAAILTAT
jgi:glycine reductase